MQPGHRPCGPGSSGPGRQGDLDAAIDNLRAAVAAIPPGHPNRAMCLSNLGNALRVRFERTGDQADLDAAVEAGRAAVATTPPDHPDRAGRLSNLSNALQDPVRADRGSGRPGRRDRGRPGRGSRYPARPPRIGRCTCPTWAARCGPGSSGPGDQADLDAAVEAGRAAVAATPPGHPEPGDVPVQPGDRAAGPVRADRRPGDLDAAIDSLPGRGSRSPRPTTLTRQCTLSTSGTALRARFETTGAQADWTDALSAFIQAVDLSSAAPSVRIWAARAAASLAARSDPGRAADLLETRVRLLPRGGAAPAGAQ